MHLTLILGPMKSGKSYDLINRFAPLEYTKTRYGLFHPSANTRDSGIRTRNGRELPARKVVSLGEIDHAVYDIIGIDEIHMFAADEAAHIGRFLRGGVRVTAAGLSLDYRGKLFGIVARLMELGPLEVRHHRAVCEDCREHNATHTQVSLGGIPQTGGLPEAIPEDGTYEYKPVCRECFVRA